MPGYRRIAINTKFTLFIYVNIYFGYLLYPGLPYQQNMLFWMGPAYGCPCVAKFKK